MNRAGVSVAGDSLWLLVITHEKEEETTRLTQTVLISNAAQHNPLSASTNTSQPSRATKLVGNEEDGALGECWSRTNHWLEGGHGGGSVLARLTWSLL